jgi:hypothetical protein
MMVKFINTICPPPPHLSLQRRAALSGNSNGKRPVYNRENPKSILYCDVPMPPTPSPLLFFSTFFEKIYGIHTCDNIIINQNLTRTTFLVHK